METHASKTSAILRYLGVEIHEVWALQGMLYPDAVRHLEDLKARIRKGFRRAALEFHPDRTQNDPQRTIIFQAISAVRDEFEALRLPEPPPIELRENLDPIGVPPTPGVVAPAPRPRGNPRGGRAATMKP